MPESIHPRSLSENRPTGPYDNKLILTDSIVHSTAEKTAPKIAKFLAYDNVVPFISLKTSLAVGCLSKSTPGAPILGLTEDENKPIAAPKP